MAPITSNSAASLCVQGPKGLFKGLFPRVLLGIWQTLFMVTGAKLVQDALLDMQTSKGAAK